MIDRCDFNFTAGAFDYSRQTAVLKSPSCFCSCFLKQQYVLGCKYQSCHVRKGSF